MENLQPQTIFPITRLLSDHTDTSTNYVRAVVKNTRTLAVVGSLSVQKMVDGFTDEYEDETGVDTAGSTNESYDTTNDLYRPSGGLDSYTKLLLHCDGTDGSATFTDETGKTVTRVGDAQIDTAQSKFGGASALFDGNGDAVTLADSDDFAFGTGDFTIDFWLKRNETGADVHNVFGQGNSGLTNGYHVGQIRPNTSKFGFGMNNEVYFPITATGITDTNWHHIAIVRNGNNIAVALDGTFGSNVDVTGVTYTNSPGKFAIGQLGEWGGSFHNGWIDEFRVSKGIARWTGNFTPPTSAYSAAIDNMTLKSVAQTAEAAPTNARVVLFEEDTDVITENTDLKAYVSRDNGTTFTQCTLSDSGDYETNKRILTGTADISAQPSGTSMKYKIETLNNKNLKLHGTAMLWS